MADTLEIGSLRMEIKPNHLVKLTITALKNGEPVSFISADHLRQMVAFYESWLLDQDEDDVEDLL